MQEIQSTEPQGDRIDCPPSATVVECIHAGETAAAAQVLAEAYAEDPVLRWALPKAATRSSDAAALFTFLLRMRPCGRKVFMTSDGSAAAVMTAFSLLDRGNSKDEHRRPSLISTSPMADYFRWIESFRPKGDHHYLEFIGCLPAQRLKGTGSFLLGNLLAEPAGAGIPVWCWSSNPRNLTFYRRLGFEIGNELRRDAGTPVVTLLSRPPLSLLPPSHLPVINTRAESSGE